MFKFTKTSSCVLRFGFSMRQYHINRWFNHPVCKNVKLCTRSFKKPVMLMSGLALLPAVKAFSFGGKKTPAESGAQGPEESITEEADMIYAKNDVHGLYTYLSQYNDTNDAHILWRLCRAACDKAKSTEDKEIKKALMYEAFEYIKKALAKDDQIFAVHKWYAIMLDYIGEYEGTKQRLSYAYQVKEHFMKAIELNPNDATSVHLLGYWCFVFADLPWYQKKVASVVFTAPPSSSFEEALKYFLQAEKTEPNFYSMNLLLLGKTYLRLNNKEMAQSYLKRAKQYPVQTADDKQAHKEAVELLKSMGVD